MSASPAELVAASRGGDAAAFAELVRRHEALVGAVVIATMGRTHQVEDVVQEVFLEAWRGLDRVRDPERFRSWLCGIARNQAAKSRRVAGREVAVADPPEVAAEAAAEAELIDRERARSVEAALAAIPAECRDAVVLFYREERSIRDVAQELGVSEAAAQKRLSRGRAALRSELGALLADHLPRTRVAGTAAAVLAALAAAPAQAHPIPKGAPPMKMTLLLTSTAAVALGAAALVVADGGAVLADPLSAPAAAKATATARPKLRRVTGEERARRMAQHRRAATPGAPKARASLKAALLGGDWEAEAQQLLLECVDLARVRRPTLHGGVSVRVTIAGDPDIAGLVTSAEVHRRRGELAEPDPELEECLEETMLSVEFAGVDRDVTVSLRFQFDPPAGVALPAPPTAEQLLARVAQLASPERLVDLADEHAEQHPEVAVAACDRAIRLDPGGAAPFSCTIIACAAGQPDRARKTWAKVSPAIGPGQRKKGVYLCGRYGVELP